MRDAGLVSTDLNTTVILFDGVKDLLGGFTLWSLHSVNPLKLKWIIQCHNSGLWMLVGGLIAVHFSWSERVAASGNWQNWFLSVCFLTDDKWSRIFECVCFRLHFWSRGGLVYFLLWIINGDYVCVNAKISIRVGAYNRIIKNPFEGDCRRRKI